MRYGKVAVALAATTAMALAACGGDDGDDEPETSPSEEVTEPADEAEDEGGELSQPDEPISLTFQTLAWQTASIEANEEIVAAWNAENPNVQVELLQGDWGSVHDQLVTSFEGGTAPDVFHYESTTLQDFADRGNVLDLTEYLSEEIRSDIRQGAWDTVTFDGIYGVPFLQESQVIFGNKALLDEASVDLPTIDDPWTWDDFQAAAAELTTADQYGAAFPLSSPANRVLNLARNFGADYFTLSDGPAEAIFGDAEGQVPSRIHQMIYTDESASPDTLGMSNSDALPGFFDGQYALLPAPIWVRQQLIEQGPDGFEWVTLPALAGDSQAQGAVSQTLSVSASTENPEWAVAFTEYFLNAENQAKLAAGDWLLPTSEAAASDPALNDAATGWDVAISTAADLEMAPFQQVKGFDEWKERVANPAYQQYFADEISLEELGAKLTGEGNDILSRYDR
jgi:ABC-type glycerol-3-phosphate transport system substrate-binding protein